jgi:short-subunit dehydrogenase
MIAQVPPPHPAFILRSPDFQHAAAFVAQVAASSTDAAINANVNGLYNMTSALLPQTLKTRGSILNVGSAMSFIGTAR